MLANPHSLMRLQKQLQRRQLIIRFVTIDPNTGDVAVPR